MALLPVALAFGERFLEFLGLECEHRSLLLVEVLLLADLALEQARFPGLLVELTLEGADLFGLLPECQDREGGGDDRERGQDRGGDGGDLRGHEEGHGRSVGRVWTVRRSVVGEGKRALQVHGPPWSWPSPDPRRPSTLAGSSGASRTVMSL